MKHFLFCLFSLTNIYCAGQKGVDKSMLVWYDKPADSVWLDGLFIGNGYMGANVFGRVGEERIALNESTFWSGRPHDYNDPECTPLFRKDKGTGLCRQIQRGGENGK